MLPLAWLPLLTPDTKDLRGKTIHTWRELTLALNFCISISNCCVVFMDARRLNRSFLKTSLIVSSARILSFSLRFAS